MKFINVSLILSALFLSGCGTSQFMELGFEVNLDPVNTPKQVWVAPIKPNQVIKWGPYLTQIRVNLADELERKAGMTVSIGNSPTLKDDYRMYLVFNEYNKTLGGGTYNCSYKANLTVEDNQQQQIFNQENQQSRRFPYIDNGEGLFTNKADDQCFQARSQLIETLLGEFIVSLGGS